MVLDCLSGMGTATSLSPFRTVHGRTVDRGPVSSQSSPLLWEIPDSHFARSRNCILENTATCLLYSYTVSREAATGHLSTDVEWFSSPESHFTESICYVIACEAPRVPSCTQQANVRCCSVSIASFLRNIPASSASGCPSEHRLHFTHPIVWKTECISPQSHHHPPLLLLRLDQIFAINAVLSSFPLLYRPNILLPSMY